MPLFSQWIDSGQNVKHWHNNSLKIIFCCWETELTQPDVTIMAASTVTGETVTLLTVIHFNEAFSVTCDDTFAFNTKVVKLTCLR